MKLKRVAKWGAGAVSSALVVAVLVAYFTSGNSCSDPNTSAPNDPTKAVIYCDYGSADVLSFVDVEKPVPGDSQVLIRVRAASVNPYDWHYMRGTPYVARMEMGLRKPKVVRLGVDFAGVVEAVGGSVTRFKPGDEVFGGGSGAFADHLSVDEDGVVLKPANLTFEQAAAVPLAAITALQGLRDAGQIQPGQRVLINGASGGVGTFAVQIAKSFGAEVTGVCSGRNADMVRSIGADQVIDYTKENFTESAQRYDLIFDVVGNHSLKALRRVLNPNGKYVMIGGPSGRWIDPLPRVFKVNLVSRFVSQEMRFFISDFNTRDLIVLRDLLETGEVTPVIDRRYEFIDVPAALRYLEEGHARGKVVVTMD